MKSRVKKHTNGLWGCNVWFGTGPGAVASSKRFYFKTRQEARKADISTTHGVVEIGTYLYKGEKRGA